MHENFKLKRKISPGITSAAMIIIIMMIKKKKHVGNHYH